MEPKNQMEHRDIGPVVPHLLLTRAMDLLDIVEVLFDGGAVGERLQDLPDRRLCIRAEERFPAAALPDQNYADQAASRSIGCQKGFEGLGDLLAIQNKVRRLPAFAVAGTLGQADRL